MNRLIVVLVAALFALPAGLSAQDTDHRLGRLWATGRWTYPGGRNEDNTNPDIEYRVGNSGVTFVPLLTTFHNFASLPVELTRHPQYSSHKLRRTLDLLVPYIPGLEEV